MNFKNYTLFETLQLLNIKINTYFNEFSPLGYHENALLCFYDKKNFFTNKLSENEIIISDYPLMLGREKIRIKNGYQIRTYYSIDDWLNIKESYQKLKEIKSVPEMIFLKEKIILQKIIKGDILLNSRNKEVHKKKIIQFIKKMNQLGYAHRDLHCKNIIISKDDIFIIDWDFVIKQSCDIFHSYDLTGTGLPSPHLTNNCNIFKSFPKIGIPSVADILNISLKDFL